MTGNFFAKRLAQHPITRRPQRPALAVLGMMLWGCALGLAAPVMAQNPTPNPIRVEVDRNIMSVSDVLQLIITVENAGEPILPLAPDFAGWAVLGSSNFTQTSLQNLQMFSTYRRTYQLMPLQPGELPIGSFEVIVGGQTYRTDPIQITVTNNGQPTPTPLPMPSNGIESGAEISLTASVDNLSPYVGQQINYRLQFATAIVLLTQPQWELPPFNQFWQIGNMQLPDTIRQENGIYYQVSEQQVLLFPLIAQPQSIPASSVHVAAFGQPDALLQSASIDLNVRPLPASAPPEFNGAVGEYQIQISLSSQNGRTGEPLEMRIELSGVGNIETLPKPKLPDLSGWRVIESGSQTQTQAQNGVWGGNKIFTYTLLPTQAGLQTIPAIPYAYFDPVREQYVQLQTAPQTVDVALGAQASITNEPNAAGIATVQALPAAWQTGNLSSSNTWLPQTALYWFCWSAPLLLLLANGGWRWAQRKAAQPSPQAAFNQAQHLLQKSKPAQIESILLQYLRLKLATPVTGVADACNTLRERSGSDALAVRLERCCLASVQNQYAPPTLQNDDSNQDLRQTALALLQDLEQAL